ncbi:MAG: M23 family peptidase, partial [Epsilonproteobacteria bacterium]
MKILLLVGLVSSILFSFNFEISGSMVSNGSTSLVEFKKDKDTRYDKISFGKKSFNIYENPIDKEKLYAFLPISYYEKPKNDMFEVFYREKGINKTRLVSIKIVDGNYAKEKITVNKSKVNPNKKHSKRISKEYKEAMKIYGTSTNKNYIESTFILPLDSFITSDFGKARVYNNSLKGYHSGTDFRAKVGTPIQSSNRGVVVLVKDRFYSGGTVLVDHGQGIYT